MNGRRSFTYRKGQSNALPSLFNRHSKFYCRTIKSMTKSLMALSEDGYFQNCETICTGRQHPWSEIPFNRIGVMIKNDKIKLLEQLYIAALLIDDHGKILWANNFTINLLGYLYNDYVGHNIQEVRRYYLFLTPKMSSTLLLIASVHSCIFVAWDSGRISIPWAIHTTSQSIEYQIIKHNTLFTPQICF